MKYRNKKTGATIEVAFAINGENWEPVGVTNKKAEPKKEEVIVEEIAISKSEEVIPMALPEEEPVAPIEEEEAKPKRKRASRKGSKKK